MALLSLANLEAHAVAHWIGHRDTTLATSNLLGSGTLFIFPRVAWVPSCARPARLRSSVCALACLGGKGAKLGPSWEVAGGRAGMADATRVRASVRAFGDR